MDTTNKTGLQEIAPIINELEAIKAHLKAALESGDRGEDSAAYQNLVKIKSILDCKKRRS